MTFQCDAFAREAFQNDCPTAGRIPVSHGHGWSRPARRWPADETDTEREARIHAERVKLGILAPDEPKPAEGEAPGATIAGGAAPVLPPESADFEAAAYGALALDLAALHTSAWLDQEIARQFRILDDEDDAAVLLLAIAVLH